MAGKLCNESIKTHAERGEFPANSIAEVKAIINPATAEQSRG